ncbi:GNAT family N-acetyltransferase [Roseobacter sp. YSTF-M11]|uniref:GNAT family N-acetyltransferase n=1 Tax=Roseobacter insulae TaxID=2859783 RepID=A0A9X1FWX3_9RHOB|nr:GNAT family N-acetyltransferase [Roseobacter insulae]MBW4709284.1 GNAT family N-acetyltransferase [Roseobacter insulae]
MTLVEDHTLIRIPTLRTERFVMRAPKPSDFEAYAAFRGSDRAAGVGGPYTREQAHDSLCGLVGHWQIEGYGRWMVTGADDTPLGVVGLMNTPAWPEPEIAWSVFAAAEGKGVAFEAAMAARAYAYTVLGWSTAISCVLRDNTRSHALAERMGATRDGSFTAPDLGELLIYRHQPARNVA